MYMYVPFSNAPTKFSFSVYYIPKLRQFFFLKGVILDFFFLLDIIKSKVFSNIYFECKFC